MDRGTVRNVQSFIPKKTEKLLHLCGCIIRMYHDTRSPERQIHTVGWQYVQCVEITASVTPTQSPLGLNAKLLLEYYNLCAHLPDIRQCDKHLIYVIWVLHLT